MRIVFSGAGIVEMHGKAQGTIIQNSYGGYQLRNLHQPVKLRTTAKQVAMRNLGAVTSAWRTLTNEERQTWIDNAPSGVSGFQFYTSTNIPLVSAGVAPLITFVAPVANPVARVADVSIILYDIGFNPPLQRFTLQSGNEAIPIGDWTPSFLWTGWIPGSRYYYPRMNLALTPLNYLFAPQSYEIIWGNDDGEVRPLPGINSKCRFKERWINSITGQIYTGNMYELYYGETLTVGQDYRSELQQSSSVLTGSPGSYNLVSTFITASPPLDTANWEPAFLTGGWFDPAGTGPTPLTISVPNTAIAFPDSSTMVITSGYAPGDADPPPTAGWRNELAVIWRNVHTGVLSYDETAELIADNF